jgi:hypothetical protein
MEATALATAPAKPRSETRQKQVRITVRLTAAEYAELEEAAGRDGISIGSFVRARALTAPTTRASRRPSVDLQALARLQAEMNRVGSNIHQLLKHIRFGGTPAGDEVVDAFKGYREVIAASLETLGRGKK